MSSSVPATRRMALLGVLALGGCGFAPAYGTSGVAQALRNRIVIATPDTIAGFALRAQLTNRLGTDTAGPYALDVTLATTTEAAAINSDGDTTHFNLVGTSTWTLTRRADDTVISAGTVDDFSSYSGTGSTVAVEAATKDATNRLMVVLADRIATDLILLAPDLP